VGDTHNNAGLAKCCVRSEFPVGIFSTSASLIA
jgi:hypothetical protein